MAAPYLIVCGTPILFSTVWHSDHQENALAPLAGTNSKMSHVRHRVTPVTIRVGVSPFCPMSSTFNVLFPGSTPVPVSQRQEMKAFSTSAPTPQDTREPREQRRHRRSCIVTGDQLRVELAVLNIMAQHSTTKWNGGGKSLGKDPIYPR